MCMTRNGRTLKAWADEVNGKPNPNRAHCINDGATLEAGEGFALCLPEAGDRPRYVCSECMRKLERKLRYHGNACERSAYDEPLGTPKKGSLEHTTIGIEIEHVSNRFSEKSFYTFKYLIERAFNVKEEDDCSVSGEFPTDKMEGGNKSSKMIRKLEKYGFFKFLDNPRTGAHIHVECTCIEFVRNWYNTLFVPLCRWLAGHSEDWLIERFGSAFRDYAEEINERTDCGIHSNFVNTQHNHTLEFRLPRMRTAEQYVTCIYFWRKVVWTLNQTAWIEKTENNRAERKAQAVEIANQILKIAIEFFE